MINPFDEFGQQLNQTRLEKADVQRELFERQEKIKQLQAEYAQLQRIIDPQNEKHQQRQAKLAAQLERAQSDAKRTQAVFSRLTDTEKSYFERFAEFTDPRTQVRNLDDQYPILLMPLRIETRWRLQEKELWVRVYPDDCAVDSFEPTLSETEITNGQRFWAGMWLAGGVEAQQRAAWRDLVASHGVGRAAWIIQQYLPLDSPMRNKVSPEDVFLVIPTTQTPDSSLMDLLHDFWIAAWLADNDPTKLNAARQPLDAEFGQAQASELIKEYTPQNFNEKPQNGKSKSEVAVDVIFLHFPSPDETASKRNSWSQPAKVNVMPDRLVLIGYQDGKEVINMLGNAIPSPLILTPDPSAKPEDQIRAENGDLIVSDEMHWMVNFERAIAVGMAFRVRLSEWSTEQFQRGLERLLVLGVRLSGNSQDGKHLLETLIQDHHYSTKGFSLLPQGTPTNNTDNGGAGFSRAQEADETFDNYVQHKVFFTPDPDDEWIQRKDGQWLAECLGIDYSALANIPHTDGTDQAEEMAMNTALFPATLGYMLRTLLKPALSWDQITDVLWFFKNFVSGRGLVPAIHIGNQPYGILPTTVYSRMAWFNSERLPLPPVARQIQTARSVVMQMSQIIKTLQPHWQAMAARVPYVRTPDDAHKTLLSILSLNPSSVEYHSRTAQSVDHLYNLMNLQGQAAIFLAGLTSTIQTKLNGGANIVEGDRTRELLKELGYPTDVEPELLELIFWRHPHLLKGPLIDDRPLSETEQIRDYALPLPPDTKNRNYLKWLTDAASTSLETLRTQSGFIDDKPPIALLYLVARYSLMQSYWETGINYQISRTGLAEEQLDTIRSEPRFIHVVTHKKDSESRWAPLYATGIVDADFPNEAVASAITRALGTHPETWNLFEQINALKSLSDLPTSRLERLFAEHIDLCSYRLDAWQQGLVRFQLAGMRSRHYRRSNTEPDKPTGGIYLGAYGWLENLRPENKVLTPVELTSDLKAVFDPDPVDGSPPLPPIVRDSKNEGYIHTPSLNQAVTAAVLHNGYTSTATPEQKELLSVNLSSERVRLALSFIEGIRGGQSLSALLGYQLERGLHDHDAFLEIDQFIYKLRKEFPLHATKLKLPVDPSTGAADPNTAPIEAMEARNVVDGLLLINHIKEQSEANKKYPFGKPLPPATPAQADVINREVDRLLDIHDALADLALAEGVHQVVQGNYDRAAATMDAYSRANFPPIPDVIQTPRTGITLTHRVGIHFVPGIALDTSPTSGIPVTPRGNAEPAINHWLASVLPEDPAKVVCRILITNPVSHAQTPREISWHDLQLQPFDLIYLVQPENQQAMAELDDRIMRHISTHSPPRPDAKIEIRHSDPSADSTKMTFFELAALTQSLRGLLLSSRPLQATDIMLTNEAKLQHEASVSIDRARVDRILNDMESLLAALNTFAANLDAILSDLPARLSDLVTGIDSLSAQFNELLASASSYGLPQTGWGFTYAWKATAFGGLFKQVTDLLERWDARWTDFTNMMTAYPTLPSGTSLEDRFEYLQRAELLVSRALTSPQPPTPDDLLPLVTAKGSNFDTRRGALHGFLGTSTTSFATLFADITPLAPIDAFDSATIDLDSTLKGLVTFASQMLQVVQGIATDVDKRTKAAHDQIDIYTGTVDSMTQVKALQAAAKALLGDDFRLVPEFMVTPEQGDEWDKAYIDGTNGNLLKYQTQTLNNDFPMDDWLYGVARVRPKLGHWERVVILTETFGRPEKKLVPVQLPYHENASWLALQYPSDAVIDGERLLYTAHYASGFNKAAAQCGLLLDEWTEVLPMKEETTGITFHYDRPNSEPPQAMLLVTPPNFTGSWNWQDLVDTLHETLNLARQRAVEPAQIDATPFNRLLPATLMALTLYEISLSANLTINNKAQDAIQRRPS